jgi:hypothetical protein
MLVPLILRTELQYLRMPRGYLCVHLRYSHGPPLLHMHFALLCTYARHGYFHRYLRMHLRDSATLYHAPIRPPLALSLASQRLSNL